MQPLLIRADANAEIGNGHVMRCLALAQVWQDHGGEVIFLCSDSLPAALQDRLYIEDVKVVLREDPSGDHVDAQFLTKLATQLGTSLVVVDGYAFDAEYQRILKNAGLRVLFLDDNGHAEHYYSSWILNQNFHADESLYRERESDTQLLLGTRFTLVRREFREWRGFQRTIIDIAKNLLVTMGGADPDNVTLDVLHAINSIPDAETLQIKVVVGGSSPHLSSLRSFVSDSRLNVEILSDVINMPELMAWADLAISAGGSTIWELCLMGVPTVALVLADNQAALVEKLAEHEAIYSTSVNGLTVRLSETCANPRRREIMSAYSRYLVDGYGTNRVSMFLRGDRVWVREATLEDCELIWRWANDPIVRQVSFSSQPISWETHLTWYKSAIEDKHLLIFIATDHNEKPIGQIRYQIEKDIATVSISLDRHARGMGYSAELLILGSDRLSSATSAMIQHAFIKPGNVASRRAFERASFRQIAKVVIRGQTALLYERQRTQ